jgi:hypothetical protein
MNKSLSGSLKKSFPTYFDNASSTLVNDDVLNEILPYFNGKFGNAKPNDANAMSNEFFDYFNSNPPVKGLKTLDYPNRDEKKICSRIL